MFQTLLRAGQENLPTNSVKNDKQSLAWLLDFAASRASGQVFTDAPSLCWQVFTSPSYHLTGRKQELLFCKGPLTPIVTNYLHKLKSQAVGGCFLSSSCEELGAFGLEYTFAVATGSGGEMGGVPKYSSIAVAAGSGGEMGGFPK